jgi:hypothetical protein
MMLRVLPPVPEHRVCALCLVEPTIELFGSRYGVCALAQECPPGECGYARTRRVISGSVENSAKNSAS